MAGWTIGRRIASGFIVLIILILVIAGFAYRDISDIASLAGLSKETTEKDLFLVERQVDHLEWVRGLELHLLGAQQFSGQIDEHKCKFGEWLYSDSARGETDREIRRLLGQIEDPHAKLHRSAEEILAASRGGDQDRARALFLANTVPALQATTGTLTALRARYDAVRAEQGGQASADLASRANTGRMFLVLVSGAALAAGVLLAVFLGRNICRSLGDVLRQLTGGAEQVASAAGQVSTSAQSLSQGAAEQAASLEQTSASMEEMAAMTRQNAEHAEEAARRMLEVDERVTESNQAIESMVQSVTGIRESSSRVSKIIKTIDEIAFQTNILALNAAVEAARAGEAGMGFAVVADEVRNLAQRSAEAARDTAALIEESIARSHEGGARVEQLVAAIKAITDTAVKVKGLVDQVSVTNRQQAQGVEQVTHATTQMQNVTQQTAAIAEESAAASEEMNAQAAELMKVVSGLRDLVGGTTARQ